MSAAVLSVSLPKQPTSANAPYGKHPDEDERGLIDGRPPLNADQVAAQEAMLAQERRKEA